MSQAGDSRGAERAGQPIGNGRIVAELGRPETPEETAARKAENSRKHRANQTLRNLVLALLASLGIVLFLVFVVVRPAPDTTPAVDYRGDAAATQSQVTATLASPTLTKGWSANSDGLDTGSTDGVTTWSIGLITPKNQYIGLEQGIKANATWLSNSVQNARATGTTTIDGVKWAVYDRRTADNPGNYGYSLSTVIDTSTIVLHGSAEPAEFRVLATALAEQLDGGTP